MIQIGSNSSILGRLIPAQVVKDMQSVLEFAVAYNKLRSLGDVNAQNLARELADAGFAFVAAIYEASKWNLKDWVLGYLLGGKSATQVGDVERKAALEVKRRAETYLLNVWARQ